MKLREFLSKKVRLRNWYLSLLKWSCFLFGIVFGSLFGWLLAPFILHILAAAVILTIAFTYVWIKALKQACAEDKVSEINDSDFF